MKITLRWQLLLAIMAMALVLSLLSFQVQSSSLCSVEVPAAGGVFAEGIVGAPQYLNPLLSDPNPVDRELVRLLFDGLTRVNPDTGELVPHIGDWTVSEDGLSVQFTLFEGWTWHDGEPVTAADAVYTYGLMQDEAFPGPAGLKAIWQSVTITPIDEMTVLFSLAQPYAPFLEATTRGLLPAHLLEGVTAVNLLTHPFNTSPVGTGPFVVTPGQNWEVNGRLHLTPAPDAWREGTQLDALAFHFYPNFETLHQDFVAGEIQAINQVAPSHLPDIAALTEARLFTTRESRYTTLLFNTEQPIAVRQALALAVNREQLVDSTRNGQGILFEGPYLPSSWSYRPDLLTAYMQDLAAAASLLEADGWLLADGAATRQKEGEPLALRLVTLESHEALATAVSQQWVSVGIATEIALATNSGELQAMLREEPFDVALFDVVPANDPDLYDFWSQEAIVRGQNYAGWNHRRASEALESGRQLWDLGERQPFYETFLRLYDDNIPALTLYQHVHTYAVRSDVNNVEIGQITHPRDRYKTLADWFMLYRNVTIACTAES
ncbi:MAG: peptide ABC transporter substrate-binding protein [Chloroflexota bacterium]